MGMPVIAPAWSGQTEFLTEENSLPVPVAHLAPAYEHEPQLLSSPGHTLTQQQRAAHQVRERQFPSFFYTPTQLRTPTTLAAAGGAPRVGQPGWACGHARQPCTPPPLEGAGRQHALCVRRV